MVVPNRTPECCSANGSSSPKQSDRASAGLSVHQQNRRRERRDPPRRQLRSGRRTQLWGPARSTLPLPRANDILASAALAVSWLTNPRMRQSARTSSPRTPSGRQPAVDDVASSRRPVCEEEATVADADSARVVVQSVHMHRHAVACSTPRTEQIAAASAFAQSQQCGSQSPHDCFWSRGGAARAIAKATRGSRAASEPRCRNATVAIVAPTAWP